MEKINWYEVLPSYLPQDANIGIINPVYLLWIVITAIAVSYILFKLIQIILYLKTKYIFLEVKPTDRANKSALSTANLFSILNTLERPKSFTNKLFKISSKVSYEIVSTKNEGIRYVLRVPKHDAKTIHKTLVAYLPGIEIAEVNDYLKQENHSGYSRVVEIIQTNSYLYPIKDLSALTEHDPIAYLTAHMTKLKSNELVSIQFVTSPISEHSHGQITNELGKIRSDLLNGNDINKYLAFNPFLLGNITQLLVNVLLFIVLTPFTFISWLVASGKEPLPAWIFDGSGKKVNEVGANKRELYKQIEEKISQPLFEVYIKIYAKAQNKSDLIERVNAISSAFESFSTTHKTIKPRRTLAPTKFFEVKNRLSIFSKPLILSAKELSSMYHLPYTDTTKTEDIVKVKSPKLPAPLSLKKTVTNFDIEFAKNTHGNEVIPIGLTLEERRRHTYILGATGTGKTTLLMHMIHQDMQKGNGLAIIDPHGDLSDKLIGIIPENRIKDVVYLNPYDVEYPIGLNVLELPKGLSPVEEQREKDFITSTLISIFHKLYDPRYSGPRMEHILRNVILTALEQDNPTLFTIYQLLTDKNYRKKATSLLNDEILKTFWKNEFDKLGSFQRAEQISPITNKLGRFLTTSMTRNILNQTDSKLNFDTIMNEKKILICNLAKGKIGEDTAYFLGSLITAKIQLSALRRVHIPEKDRSDFFLYIDEFQNFATQSFAEILSEARKYRLSVILAHQNTVQIENDLLETIIGNTGTLICFRTSSPQDENKLLPVFAPEVEKGQIANLPSYNFYMKINALQPQITFSGEIDDFTVGSNEEIRNSVITSSRDTYGRSLGQSYWKPKNNRRDKKQKDMNSNKVETKSQSKNIFELIK